MLPYFKKYTIYVCIIAVALPVITSTVYSLAYGQIMASSFSGMLIEIALLFLGMIIGFNIFERKAEAKTSALLATYNDACDPEKLVHDGAQLASNISFPCNESGAWYLSTYAQALLEVGRIDEAQKIYDGIEHSIEAARKPEAKAGTLVNLVPLSEKMRTLDETISLIEKGLDLLRGQTSGAATERRAYLNSQKMVFDARKKGDLHDVVKLDEVVKTNPGYPMRVRVEYAWNEGSAFYRLGNKEAERENLAFVIEHGGSLKLVGQAQTRLAAL